MKKRNILVGTLVITGVLFTTGCTGKFHKGNFENNMFQKLDNDSDGFVSKKEHFQIAVERFDRSDDNEDGKITKEELKECRFAKIMPYFVENYFAKNDLDKDGFVTKAEINKQVENEFIKSDTNKDNKLTYKEMKEYRMESRFEEIDKNGDGVISKDEYKEQKSPLRR